MVKRDESAQAMIDAVRSDVVKPRRRRKDRNVEAEQETDRRET
jgi:hypothetical protein